MTRGKYAAKANGQRAETAQNTAAQLQTQIAEMRREHATEVAALKAEISSLQGKLVREVRELAATEVGRVRAEAREAINREHANRQAAAEKIARILIGEDVSTTREVYRDLAELLGIEFGKFAELDGQNHSRQLRRATAKKGRASEEVLRQRQSVPSVALVTSRDLA